MNKLFCIATAAAALVAGGAQAQPYGYAGGYLPAPAYAYAGYNGGGQGGGYSQAYDEGNCDSFTIVGAHAGVTVLGLNAGAGAHLGVGDDACRGHHHSRIQFTPPPAPQYAPPPQYAPQGPCCMAPPPQYAPPPRPCCMAPPPPPPSPCDCAPQYGAQPYGW
ncbi:hypothetical protein [Caulobacter sp. S45]|uniref:hypothetical protein n=1 Tax=Caulobacter sp. S45 TaxID=1641861 RepID=UPI00131E6972|nr:hypothetical protein [Caulobacter sp. S45]